MLLLLDEPFSALDVANRRNLRSCLKELKNELNIPILHVTHDLDEALFLGDTILAVESGRIAPDWLKEQQAIQRRLAVSGLARAKARPLPAPMNRGPWSTRSSAADDRAGFEGASGGNPPGAFSSRAG